MRVPQPVPDVSAADVERVLGREFPDAAEEAREALKDCGDAPRVRLAALKLAKGDLAALRRWAGEAAKDYRDVLAPAEYPAYLRKSPSELDRMPENEQRALIEADWRQYRDWLGR